MTGSQESLRWSELAILIAILAVAVLLRTWQLGSVPPGLTHDEAGNGYDAMGVLHGLRPIHFSVGYGREPLYQYSAALMMSLLGPTVAALRLTTVVWGLIVLVLSYAFARYLFGSLTGVLTLGWMAISFWCVMTSRVGLRAITSTAMFSASAYSFWRAFYPSGAKAVGAANRRWLWLGLSGLFLGASIYTYMASRAMPAVYLLFLGYLSLLHLVGLRLTGTHTRTFARDPGKGGAASLRQQWIRVFVLLLIAALVAAPLVHHLIVHPEAEQRIGQLSTPLREALAGDLEGLWDRVVRSLPMFTFQGDPLWLYNIPGRPLLDVTVGAFFYAGLLVCLWHFRDPRYAFLLLWLIVGVSPALVTGPDATTLRSIVAQPAVFITASLGLATAVRFLGRRTGRWGRIALGAAVATLLAITGAGTVHAYFNVWAHHRDVRVAYHHALVQQARYLDASPESGMVSISSIYPGRFHDPYTMEVSLRRNDLSLRWFDGRFALVFPQSRESRVIIPSIAPLDEALEPFMVSHASLIHTESFRPDDLVTGFDVYRFDSANALLALLQAVGDNPVAWSRMTAFPAQDPESVYQPLELPVKVNGAVSLLGYELRTPTVEPGDEVALLTVWHVRESLTSEVVAFTHVLSHEGRIIGQLDRLDVPSWTWEPGDTFVQVHRFALEPDTPSGRYPVAVGLYVREGSTRLPIIVDDVSVDDRILLHPLQVVGE